jgi:hypothetical protein
MSGGRSGPMFFEKIDTEVNGIFYVIHLRMREIVLLFFINSILIAASYIIGYCSVG